MPGKYIVVEGTEGAGKTTQINKIMNHMRANGHLAVLTREPGATNLGQEIRRILLDIDESPKLSIDTQVMLFQAAYRHSLETLIIPALKTGINVISDRSNISSFVYQREATITPTLLLNNDKLKSPDIVFLLLIDYDTAKQRLDKRQGYTNYKDNIDAKQHQFLFDGYMEYYRTHPDNTILIDASQPEDVVFSTIVQHLNELGII